MNKSRKDKRRSLERTLFVLLLLLCGWIGDGLAQESKVDINALTQETQRIFQKVDEITLVWWIPEEFWRVSLTQDPTITQSQIEEFIRILQPYIVIVVVDGKVGRFGGVTYKSEAEIRVSIRIIDNQGISYPPLSEDGFDADTKNFLSIIKPVLANMLGPLGQNMHFFLFPAKSKKGQNIAEATKKGGFLVKFGEKEFRWRLPLGSLLPTKICPVDGEEMSGAWNFCPWHGVELKVIGNATATSEAFHPAQETKQIKLLYTMEEDTPVPRKEIWLSYFDEDAKKWVIKKVVIAEDGSAKFKIPAGKSGESYTFTFAFTEAEVKKFISEIMDNKRLGLRIPPDSKQSSLTLKVDSSYKITNVEGSVQLWRPE